MPNWCTNSMVIYGSFQELKDFREKCLQAQDNAKRAKVWDLYQLYVECGEEREDILKSDSNGYIRGWFDYIGHIKFDEELSMPYFQIEYESAWSSMYEGFDYLLKKYYKTLQEVTLAEEYGMDLYINTDEKGLFFKERYHVYIENYDTYTCATWEEVEKIKQMHKGDSIQINEYCRD